MSNIQPVTTVPADNLPLPNRDALLSALSNPLRWLIMRELSLGEPLVAGDIGAITGIKTSAISKHFNKLVAAGIVETGRGNTYRIARPYRPALGVPIKVLDFGHCVLRFDLEKGE